MNSLMHKLKRRAQITGKMFYEDLRFSKRLALYRVIDDLTWRIGLSGIANFFHEKKDKVILNYLEKKLSVVIEKYKKDHNCGEFVDNAPVWVCWWSGVETAPDLVKQCIKSIQKKAGEHPVNIITESTYKEYLQIPEYILTKVNRGQMCIANFSDYLRISLIEKYGGLWLDATIYCAKEIPESYFEQCLFTCKSEPTPSRYISNYRWTSFCLAGWKHNVFYRFFKEAMEEYWKNENYSIDYLLVDYLIEVGYSNVGEIKKCFDSVFPNNLQRDDLQKAMNETISATYFEKILQEDTVLYKLSWREQYSKETSWGEKSIYARFLELDM